MSLMSKNAFIILAFLCRISDAQTTCTLCADGVAPSNANRVIPFLAVSGNPNPTCQDLAAFAPDASGQTNGQEICSLIQAQANYCGCPETSGEPLNECQFCPGGDAPGDGGVVTPFGDTCDELAEYVSFLPESECDTQRLEILLRNDFICKCPGADTPCNFCPDGSNDIANPDLVIPFFNIPDNDNATCADAANYISLVDPENANCDLLAAQGGYCGCPGATPQNKCFLCPDGSLPANPDLVTPTGDKCSELYAYLSFLNETQCEETVVQSIQGLGYVCGCPGVTPACTLCPNGESPIDPSATAVNDGTTCGELEVIVTTLTEKICVAEQERLDAGRFRCCASGSVELPSCSIQQNPTMCTAELLASTTEICECYTFCNGDFVECTSFPGDVLPSSECRGTIVSGCNLAAISHAPRNVPAFASGMILSVTMTLWFFLYQS